METKPQRSDLVIWGFALGYFLCYAPYSALSKVVSDGRLPGMTGRIDGFELLPVTAMASLVGMFVFITAMGWWKHAGRRTVLGVSVPMPNRWTFMSGLCTAAIIPTTTLAYTFGKLGIVFMMLMMRGGVLIIAPIVDFIAGRHVRWFSWAALALTLGAVAAPLVGAQGYEITLVAVVDVAIYLASYFVRLRFMSRLAKSDDLDARTRYFVEEQMTATPVLVLALGVLALVGSGEQLEAIRHGFTTFWQQGATVVLVAVLIGIMSQGTGVFGGLILLEKQENSFCVPVNRASSVLAGLLASGALTLFVDKPPPGTGEFVGAGLIIAAIVVLSVPGFLAMRRRAVGAAG